MASLPHFTVKEYNNIPRMDDAEHATWLLTKLEQDARDLLNFLDTMHTRYTEGVPQTTCDQLGQLVEDIVDRLSRIDPAQRAEYAAWEDSQALHDVVAFHDLYVTDSIQGGHC